MSKSRNDRQSRDRRKKEALVRNEKWAALTPEQQMQQLSTVTGCIKQKAKIQKKIDSK
jgi:hypothetical protein